MLAAVPELMAITTMPAMIASIPPSCQLFNLSRMTNQAAKATSIAFADVMATTP